MRRSACAIAYAAVAATSTLSACDRENAASATNDAVPSADALSPASSRHVDMRFSPDRRRVSYFTPGASGFDLVVAKADLSEPRRFATVRHTNPVVWSPDGRKLAYANDDAGIQNLAVLSLANGTARRLTTGKSIELPSSWHPRGDRVAYLATAPGGTFWTSAASIVDGTTAPMVSEPLPHLAEWSPDGTRIAYNRIEGGRGSIWLADSTGANPRPLTIEGFKLLRRRHRRRPMESSLPTPPHAPAPATSG